MTAPTFYNYITTFSSETSSRSGMLCEGLSRIFTIKSIRLLNNVKLHEYVIHRLKIPRPPAVPVQARLRVPEQKKPLQTCLRRLFHFSSGPSPGGTSPQPKGEAGQARPSHPGITQARARPNINKRWPRKRLPPGRFHRADAACRKGCPASPARPRPAGPASSSVTRRAAFRSPPNDKRPPLRG